jgi:hypothetical protein
MNNNNQFEDIIYDKFDRWKSKEERKQWILDLKEKDKRKYYQWAKSKYTCECGEIVQRRNRGEHNKKNLIHKKYLNDLMSRKKIVPIKKDYKNNEPNLCLQIC